MERSLASAPQWPVEILFIGLLMERKTAALMCPLRDSVEVGGLLGWTEERIEGLKDGRKGHTDKRTHG